MSTFTGLTGALPRPEIVDKTGKLLPQWFSWFSAVYTLILLPQGNNGTTANRPTTNLWIGQMYLDTTLGKPIWILSLNPTVWIDATGASV